MVIHSQMVGFCFFFYIAHINSKSGWWFHTLVISILTWDDEFQWLSICSEAGGSSCRKYDDGTFAETPSFSESFTLTNPSTSITLPMFDGRTQIFNGKTLSSLVKRSCAADACWYQQEQVQWYQWCRWSPGMVQCWSQGRHNTGHTMPRKFSIGKRSWCAMKRSLQRIFPLWGTSRCGTCWASDVQKRPPAIQLQSKNLGLCMLFQGPVCALRRVYLSNLSSDTK